MKRIILALFLMFNFQFALADIASDIALGLSAEQAAINAQADGLGADAIAAQLVAAGISDSVVIALALVSAGFTNTGTIASALTAAGFSGPDIADAVSKAGAKIALAPPPGAPPGPPPVTPVSGGGGGGGGGADTGPPVSPVVPSF